MKFRLRSADQSKRLMVASMSSTNLGSICEVLSTGDKESAIDVPDSDLRWAVRRLDWYAAGCFLQQNRNISLGQVGPMQCDSISDHKPCNNPEEEHPCGGLRLFAGQND